ncbi:hypothetical protein AVEN_147818-1 [Araneus ventricosus]|uniref:DUF5641 domain-containing protein n=1 Tax=Araneus ventricosus TaxID=182803 RepID=A0A4Y2CR64_ARAVE|nr:hypothetical protein AVEN_147818-1 [Araneus ventricosus]
MLTLLCDCEATINGRPLTYLTDNPNELRPLTPGHCIQDLKEQETIDLDLIDSQHLLKRIRCLHTLRLNLRKRFYKEYLAELVIELFPGKDKVERVVRLRVANGEIIRPVYPLELISVDKLSEVSQEEKAMPEPRPSRANVPNSKVSQKTETTPEPEPSDTNEQDETRFIRSGR